MRVNIKGMTSSQFSTHASPSSPAALPIQGTGEAAIACCPPLMAGKLTPEAAKSLAVLFRVMGEPVRLQMLSLIAAQPNQEVCACELVETLRLSQPTVSHHLKVMYKAGLLEKERRGTWIYYRVVRSQLDTLRDVLS